ncbi:hypothetical protein [Vulgatibacter sp.]|uniref:hypothetical protein n=1 Tax=Vulgatibacter sp. TaxID=1971226 RepID=UPI003569390F
MNGKAWLAALLVLGAGCGTDEDASNEAALSALASMEEEAARHHEAVAGAADRDAMTAEHERHHGRMLDAVDELEAGLRGCEDGAGHHMAGAGMGMTETRAEVERHHAAVEGTADLEEVRALCDGYHETLQAHLGPMHERMGGMHCGGRGMHR